MSKSILIADDSPGVRMAVRSFFEQDEVVCEEAVDGLDAVEKATAHKPDLILLDFRMPGINGIDAAKLLRSSLPSTPIILFTMFRELIGNAETQAAGINAVFSKTDTKGLKHYVELLLSSQPDSPLPPH